jgi:2-polyprenyl-3-methyl-5-hydroxy-6-metoxy-1,4-benzoquinol methylase
MNLLNANILYRLSHKYRQKPKSKEETDINSEAYHINYAINNQFTTKLRFGFPYNFQGKNILEIGCGQGGISVFFALNGANHVTGIDLNTQHLNYAKKVQEVFEKRLNMKESSLPVTFKEMNAYDMLSLGKGSFDFIIADNVFEHFMEPEKVLEQSYQLLKPGGRLVIPIFNSIYSKQGAHVKYGLGIPWVYCLASEKEIIKALYKVAEKDKTVLDAYPGLNGNPTRLCEIRKYKDLNGITHNKLKKLANKAKFNIESFDISPPFNGNRMNSIAKIFTNMALIKHSKLGDILSKNASAVLIKK